MIKDKPSYEQAADWLQRLDHPQVKEEDIQSWLEWFGTSDDNRKAFEELQELRRKLRALPAPRREELKRRSGVNAVELHTGESAPLDSTVSGGASAKRLTARRRTFAYGAIAASLGAVAIGLTAMFALRTPDSSSYAAPVDRHRTVSLDDGSSLVLGADAMVDVTYARDRRSLSIQRGEAYFEVRPDASRPFVVQAGRVRVTAIGTAFNMQRDADKVTVTVTEGKVSVSSAAPARSTVEGRGNSGDTPEQDDVLLNTGQRTVLPLGAPVRNVSVAGETAAPKWTGDRADFIDAPLGDVIVAINRYAPAKLVINDPRVADLTYSGTIFREYVNEWVQSLPQVYPVRTVALEDGAVSLVSRGATAK